MAGIMKKFLGMSALLFAFVAGACDSSVTEPARDQQNADVKPVAVMDVDGSFYMLPPAKMYPSGTTVSAWIDSDGGTVQLGDFAALKVPGHAVWKHTLFTIQVVQNGYVELQLSAKQWKDWKWVDVGSSGFYKPVYLFVNSAYANLNSTGMTSDGVNASRLTMLWEVDGTLGGTFENTSSIANGGWVVSTLYHFSQYVMASN